MSKDLDSIGKLLSLLVVLLPAVGVMVRLVAFSFDPILRPALRFSIAAPLPNLLATGALNAVALIGLSITFLLAMRSARYTLTVDRVLRDWKDLSEREERLQEQHRRLHTIGASLSKRVANYPTNVALPPDLAREIRAWNAMSRSFLNQFEADSEEIGGALLGIRAQLDEAAHQRKKLWWDRAFPHPMLALAGLLGLVVVVLLMPHWPTVLVLPLGGFVTSWLARRLVAQEAGLSLIRAWPAVAVMCVFAIIYGGLTGTAVGVRAAEYEFRNGTASN